MIGVPGTALVQALADLHRAGLVVARAGPDGGYESSRPLSAVTLAELIEVEPRARRSCRVGDATCAGRCRVCAAFESARVAAARDLARVTLDQLGDGAPASEHAIRHGASRTAPVVAFVD